MRVLVTGSSSGIGRAICLKFLQNNFEVIGFDIEESTINHKNYMHYKQDICGHLPDLQELDIIINNAGIQEGNVIDVNLKGMQG